MKNLGYQPAEIVRGKDYEFGGFGALGGVELQPSANWSAYLPGDESQYQFGFDPQDCVTQGTLNSVETLIRRKLGETRNYSKRFLAAASGTKPTGNDPHTVAETLRNRGVVTEADYPITPDANTWEGFYKLLTDQLYQLALAFTAEFSFGHEYVATYPEALKNALKYSPLGVSVYAWMFDGNQEVYYRPLGYPDTHWVMLYGYEEGKAWLIFDSYDHSHKRLAWDFQFGVAKRYTLDRQVVSEQSWVQFLVTLVLAAFGLPKPAPTMPVEASSSPADVPTVPLPTPPTPTPEYDWSTPATARHSTRVICDEMGLSLADKNLITACIMQESEFYNTAVCHNRNSKGAITSSDWGICQINDKYHVGPGKEFTSAKEIVDHPEKAVRFMITCFKRGQLNLWVSYSSGAYKKYL